MWTASLFEKQQPTDLYFDINDIVREFCQESKSDIRDVIDFQTVKHMKWTKDRDESGEYEDVYGNYRFEPKIASNTGQQIRFKGVDKPRKIKSQKFRYEFNKVKYCEKTEEFNNLAEIRSMN